MPTKTERISADESGNADMPQGQCQSQNAPVYSMERIGIEPMTSSLQSAFYRWSATVGNGEKSLETLDMSTSAARPLRSPNSYGLIRTSIALAFSSDDCAMAFRSKAFPQRHQRSKQHVRLSGATAAFGHDSAPNSCSRSAGRGRNGQSTARCSRRVPWVQARNNLFVWPAAE
jgi:hypothetical protein